MPVVRHAFEVIVPLFVPGMVRQRLLLVAAAGPAVSTIVARTSADTEVRRRFVSVPLVVLGDVFAPVRERCRQAGWLSIAIAAISIAARAVTATGVDNLLISR